MPAVSAEALRATATDWLLDQSPRAAGVYRSEGGRDLYLTNGIVTRRFRVTPNLATVGLNDLRTGQSVLRAVSPEARIAIDGVTYEVGGLSGQPNSAYLTEDWIDALQASPGAMRCVSVSTGPIEERMAWAQVRHHAPGAAWPPKGVHLKFDYEMPDDATAATEKAIRVSVHYELYDGLPVICKWLTVQNGGEAAITLDSFTSEILAAVEYGSVVDARETILPNPNIHVETDFTYGGMSALDSARHSVYWMPDPNYLTQVNYERTTPCLIEVRPELGPAQVLKLGESFISFRAWVMPLDSYDRERNGLAQRRMYRTLSPWATENPLMMHVRRSDRDSVFLALDQCADVGFEMAILTFGSGFNVEDEGADNLKNMGEYAAYAKSKGIEIGGYSLLASRQIDAENDVVMPEGKKPTFGASPCLGSAWGEDYFRKLYAFYDRTGFMLLEHDGSYPGDTCLSTLHPGHAGHADSLWKQWTKITDFYQWCREKGVYLNVPDYYFASGSNKTGMGYRETNWSLPRAQQVIHTRQNIYDGTWDKTPSMGWMFVPLTEYQGGGAEATIEPLDAHLDRYERMLVSNLAFGVQACYRGPRLYDTDRTRDMVAKWVAWYKEYRDILESDVIHGRRADARGLDWALHVNPALERKGMLVVFNPLNETVTQTLKVPVYYTGLQDTAEIRPHDKDGKQATISRNYTVEIEVTVPAEGFEWVVIE